MSKDIEFIKDLANDRVMQKKTRLENLKMILKYNEWAEFGWNKEDLENKIKELEEYIYVATH